MAVSLVWRKCISLKQKLLFSKMKFIPSNTKSLLILLGISVGYLFIRKVIASRPRSCGKFEYRFSTSNVTSILCLSTSFVWKVLQQIFCFFNVTFYVFGKWSE